MNYYQNNIGDYAAATRHLSLLEHGVYRMMLDLYYLSEGPLPADHDQLCRKVSARTKEEKKAVADVASEFFYLCDGMLHQKRCDEEIDRFLESEPEREVKKENERERQKRTRERRKSLFESLRTHGVVPAYDIPMKELVTLESRVTGCDITANVTQVTTPVTRDATADIQDTLNNKQETTPPTPRKRGDGFDPLSVTLPGFLNEDCWIDWVSFRAGIRKPLTEASVKQQLRDLETWKRSGHDPVAIIETSIRNGWQGLFEPKQSGGSGASVSLSQRSANDMRQALEVYGAPGNH